MTAAKSFSEYLVDQGAITADQLIDTLIGQANTQPTTLELVKKNGLLNSAQILRTIAHQMKSVDPIDFSTACRQLGYWSPSLSDALGSQESRLRAPIADLLLKSGFISNEKLVHFLDMYLSDFAESPTAVSVAPVSREPEPDPTAADSGSSSSSLEHFRDYFSPNAHATLAHLASLWNQNDPSSVTVLIDQLHGLVGAARFAKLTALEDLFKEAESSVRGASDLPSPISDGLMNALREDLCSIVERAWTLKEKL